MKALLCYLTLVVLSFFSASYLYAESLTLLPVHIGGRVLERKVNGAIAYEYSWPSVYFESAFRGDVLSLKFDDKHNTFQLIIDDRQPILIKKPGKVDYAVENLGQGRHRVRLEKISETQEHAGRFLGFYAKIKTKKIKPKRRRIEFIGDSFTVGYGNTSESRECSDAQLFDSTNSQLAFGPLVAKHFNADYQVNASSGYGVVRNYDGGNSQRSLLALYPFTLYSNNYIYSGDWQPQVLVIGLGTNDFSTELTPDEGWDSRQALRADYMDKYTQFVKTLSLRHPRAYFVLMASDQMQGEIAEQVTEVAANAKRLGVTSIDYLIFKNLDYSGCHWHPSAQDNQYLAEQLIDWLTSKKVW